MDKTNVLKTSTTKSQMYADLGMVVAAIIWGTSTVITKVALVNLSPFTFQTLRFSIAFFILAVIFYKSFIKVSKNEWSIGVLSGIAICATYSFQVVSLLYTTVTNATFISALSVIIIPVIESILKKKLPHRTLFISVFLCVIGLYLLTGWSGSFNFGDFLCLLCAISYSFYTLLIDRKGKHLNGINLSIIQLLTAAVLSLIIALFTEKIALAPIIDSWYILAFVGIFSTALVIPAQMICQKYTTPTKIGMIVLLEPVSAAILAFIFLHEILTISSIIGCCFIIGGLILAELKNV
ncbi:DMT family transporter [Inediibacterium massiliense]|uniref:DMT family transporter n=1 Tax=Inediibacterium massiliense TaxID=1658111 RepID=UPI0006B677E6|nr:DMT family transporter [Inediibacterium massiliense]